ncbi:MAG: biotin synthase BioB [Rikenellaceae bacterium]
MHYKLISAKVIKMVCKEIEILEKKIKEGYEISLEEVVELVNLEDKSLLYEMADRLRQHFCGHYFDMCSIINARSGECSEDCKWCSQSRFHNCKISVYPLVSATECDKMAKNNESKGVRRFSLVTSGRTLSDRDVEKSAAIYKELSSKYSMELCASMGLLNEKQLRTLVDSGVTRYHCNMETAPSFFPTLCTTHTVEDKLQTIAAARKVGMKVCSGGIIGMGESVEQRIEFAMFLRELAPDSIPINILNPIKGSKLENQAPLTTEEILTTMAIFRIVNPRASIRFAGGRGALPVEKQLAALRAGINGAIVGDLLTTIGDKDIESDKKMFSEIYNEF